MGFLEDVIRGKRATYPRERVVEHPERDNRILIAASKRKFPRKNIELEHDFHPVRLRRFVGLFHSHTQSFARLPKFFFRHRSNRERANYRDEHVASNLTKRQLLTLLDIERRAYLFR